MFCGKRKLYLKNISIKKLIEILKPYENLQVRVSGQDSFYIHFDQDVDYIDLNQLDVFRLYGKEGESCKKCPAYDQTVGCSCSGINCMTDHLYNDITNNKSSSEEEKVIIDDGMEEETEVNDKSDLVDIINDISSTLLALKYKLDNLCDKL